MEITDEREEIFVGQPSFGRGTDELMRLIETSDGIGDTLADIDGDLVSLPFSQRLKELMEAQDLKAAKLAERSLMSRSFVYQLCDGEREPGRDVVIRLAFVLAAGVRETQRLLRSANRGALYPRVKRDAVIIYALKEGYDITAADELLAELGEEPLVKS